MIVTPCPRPRPGPSLVRASERVEPDFRASPLSSDARIDRVVVFLGVTGASSLELFDKGVRKGRKTGRDLLLDVIIPPWCLVVPADLEFDAMVEAAMWIGLTMAARKLGHDDTPFVSGLRAVQMSESAWAVFAPFLSGDVGVRSG
jgi:hypothetical protein